MKNTILLFTFILTSHLLFSQYQIHSSVFGGGATVSNSSYNLSGSVFQTHTGKSISSEYTMDIGFWATYYFKLYPPVFLPTIQATNITFSRVTNNSMRVSWTRGNGENSLLLGRERYRIISTPLIDGITYAANSYYPSANEVANSKILYNGNAQNPIINITGLKRNMIYYYKVCEYNGSTRRELYLQTENETNPSSRWTLKRDNMREEDLNVVYKIPYPNPVINTLSITIELFENSQVEAKLFSIDGKQEINLFSNNLEIGLHNLDFDVRRIISGNYQLIIIKGSEAISYPVNVVR